MARPTVVAMVFGALVAATVIVVGARYLDTFQAMAPDVRGVSYGLVAYGVLLAAVTASRVVDPRLPIPLVAYPVLLAFILIAAVGAARRREEEGRRSFHDRDERRGPFGQHMRRGWAIFVVLFALGMCAGPLVYAHTRAAALRAP